MTTGLAVVIASTALFALAMAVATSSPNSDHRHGPAFNRGFARRLAAGATVALVTVAMSGWLVPALVIGVAVYLGVGRWQARGRSGAGDVERTDALASWIEHLRDVLIAGDQPIGAIAATVPTCPPAIRGPVRRLSTALGHQDPEVAFRRFADDLDDPLGDLVAAGLLVAVRRGARTVGVLSSLAAQARTQADRRRVLEAERAPVQREVLLLTLIMGALLLGVLLFGRADYLDAYDTPSGQLFLAVVVAAYGALLLRIQRLARFPRPARFLTASADPDRAVGRDRR